MAGIGLTPRQLVSTLRAEALGELLRKGAWALADQALISGTSFLTMVLVARAVTPYDFGIYSLSYTGLLFLNSIQLGLIIEPHATLGAPLPNDEYARYTTDTGWIQIALTGFTSLPMLAVSLLSVMRGWGITPVLLTVVITAIPFQLQALVRRAMYTHSDILGALLNDFVSCGGHLVLVVTSWKIGNLSLITSIAIIGATSAAATALGFWQIRKQLDGRFDRRRIATTFRKNWNFGKWLLGGHMAFWASGQIYPILAAGFVSVATTGMLRAAQTILGPTTILLTALDTLFTPRAARLYSQYGMARLQSYLAKLGLLVVFLTGTYCLLVATFADAILRIVFSPEYARHSWLLILYAATTFLAAVRAPARIGFKTIGMTSPIFRIYLASGIVNLTVGVALVALTGLAGIAIGLTLNAITLFTVTLHYQRAFLGKSATTDTGRTLAQAPTRGRLERRYP